MFPGQSDPTGDPESWTQDELRRWLAAVRSPLSFEDSVCQLSLTLAQRNLHPQNSDTREQLLERVKANMRIPRP